MIDTVDLYFLRNRQRRLSLRFLSWFILGENIQTDTHDSIEDARSALRLYKAYHEFEERGVFDEKLEELYRAGKRHVRDATHFVFMLIDVCNRIGNHRRRRRRQRPPLRQLLLVTSSPNPVRSRSRYRQSPLRRFKARQDKDMRQYRYKRQA